MGEENERKEKEREREREFFNASLLACLASGKRVG